MLRANPGHAPIHLRPPRAEKNSPATTFFPCMFDCLAFGINFTSLRRALFGTIALTEFVLKTRCHKLCILVPLPPYTQLSPSYSTSWTHNFSGQSHCWKLSRKTSATSFAFLHRSLAAELPPSYFHASQSIHARPALPSRSLQRRSPQAISKLFPRVALHLRPCLPSFLSSIPSFLPSFPLSFLPSFLPCSSGSSVSLPSRRRKLDENPNIADAFG